MRWNVPATAEEALRDIIRAWETRPVYVHESDWLAWQMELVIKQARDVLRKLDEKSSETAA